LKIQAEYLWRLQHVQLELVFTAKLDLLQNFHYQQVSIAYYILNNEHVIGVLCCNLAMFNSRSRDVITHFVRVFNFMLRIFDTFEIQYMSFTRC